MEVALAHDYLLVMRGAERTFLAMSRCWPRAPIATTLYSQDGTQGRFAARDIQVSFLQRLHVGQQGFRRLLPLFPRAVASLDLGAADLVVSSSSAFAHGVRVPGETVHVCYCHSPFRYAWHDRSMALTSGPRPARPVLSATLERIRRWDLAAAQRVTRYIANSRLTQRRIEEFYGRDSTIVHPPVEMHRFSVGEPEDFFLVVSELVAHKRIEVVLQAARRAGARVKVVGDGPERRRLEHNHPEVAFLGRVEDVELARLYARARALLVPNVEEFGITAVEAQAAGRPVVAPSAGGASETVLDGRTGVLLGTPTVDAFAEVIREEDFGRFSAADATASAARFSGPSFEAQLTRVVGEAATGGGAHR